MSKLIKKTVDEIMSPAFSFVTDKVVFLNTDKTACLSIGKTLIDGSQMLYVYAQLWDGSRWCVDKMLLCHDAGDIIVTLKTWLSMHTERRFR